MSSGERNLYSVFDFFTGLKTEEIRIGWHGNARTAIEQYFINRRTDSEFLAEDDLGNRIDGAEVLVHLPFEIYTGKSIPKCFKDLWWVYHRDRERHHNRWDVYFICHSKTETRGNYDAAYAFEANIASMCGDEPVIGNIHAVAYDYDSYPVEIRAHDSVIKENVEEEAELVKQRIMRERDLRRQKREEKKRKEAEYCLLYTSPSPRDS